MPDVEAPQDLPDDLKVKATAKTKDKDQPALQSYIPPDPGADKALTAAYALLRKITADARPSPANIAREHAQ